MSQRIGRDFQIRSIGHSLGGNTLEFIFHGEPPQLSLAHRCGCRRPRGPVTHLVQGSGLVGRAELYGLGRGYPAFAETVLPAFEAATDIKVNLTEQPDNGGIFAATKVAAVSGGIDMIEPTIDTVGQYVSNGLVASWDKAKLVIGNYLPGLADGAAGERSRKDGALLYVPSNCGAPRLWSTTRKPRFWATRPPWLPCSTRPTRLCCVRVRH